MPVTEEQMRFDSTHARLQSNQICGDRKIDSACRGDWGQEEGDFVFSGCRASVLEDGKRLGMDSSES